MMIRIVFTVIAALVAAPQAPGEALEPACLACSRAQAFLDARNGAPAWTGPGNEGRLGSLLTAIRGAYGHGLDPRLYHLAELERADPAHADPRVEFLASDAYLALGAHLLAGRINPQTLDPQWTSVRQDHDLTAHLESALDNGVIPESLYALAPSHDGYNALTKALARYRALEQTGGWGAVDAGPGLRLGQTGPRVAQLRARLAAEGFETGGAAQGKEFFDKALEAALIAFQHFTGLDADAIAGAATLEALNTSVAQRIEQIRANLERWRWGPEYAESRYIEVSIPQFELRAYENGLEAQRRRVIVGRPSRPTPVFSSQMRYFVVNPWWETPHSLAVRDELPAFRRDPDRVERLGFMVLDRLTGEPVDPSTIDWSATPASGFPYRLRQAPGPLNALGVVKMMLTGGLSIHLHDTPARHLFESRVRAFSSGCIRVEHALELAAWTLGGDLAEQAGALRAVAERDREQRVNLDRPLTVHVTYRTVVADGASSVRFLPDLYGHDGGVVAAMRSGDAPQETRFEVTDPDDVAGCRAEPGAG